MTKKQAFLSILLCTLAFFLYADVYEVTEKNYRTIVEESVKPVVIDLYATWCPPCRRMAPVLEDASTRYPDIRFVKIDVDAEPALAKRFDVKQLPTLLFVLPKQSSPSFRSTGLLSEKVLDEKISQLQKMAR